MPAPVESDAAESAVLKERLWKRIEPRPWRWFRFRTEYPELYAFASKRVTNVIMMLVAVSYCQRVIYRPAGEVYGPGLTAIGVTAALAGICFSAVTAGFDAATAQGFRYAGEKLLHATVLLVQVVFLMFARDSWLGPMVQNHATLKSVVNSGVNIIAFWVITTATWSWCWALSEMNDRLWALWKARTAAAAKESVK